MTPQGFIDYALLHGPAMQLGKFLVPEFVNEIGMTIEDLKQLEPLAKALDTKHQYEKIIYDAYIENNKFELTEEQLNAAYSEYKKEREEE